MNLRACPTSIHVIKQAQQTCLLTRYLYCIWSFEKSVTIKVTWMPEDRRKEGGSVESHALHKGCQGTGVVDRLFCTPIKPATPYISDSNVFTFFYSRHIPALSQFQIIIHQHSKTTLKSSRTHCCMSVSQTHCRTQEKKNLL